MAYEKQTWQTGDVVTAEKMNHIEQGVVASVTGVAYEDFNANMSISAQNYAAAGSVSTTGKSIPFDRISGVVVRYPNAPTGTQQTYIVTIRNLVENTSTGYLSAIELYAIRGVSGQSVGQALGCQVTVRVFYLT